LAYNLATSCLGCEPKARVVTALVINDSTNDEDSINVPKIQKPKSRIRKPRINDIKWSNLLGD
jgi:hypothetical protein